MRWGIWVCLILLPRESFGFSMGANAGMDFPLYHSEDTNPGLGAEAYFRTDPYELRFHYSYVNRHQYSVVAAMKLFFTESEFRPYAEAFGGPLVVDTPREGLSYGFTPGASLGADLALNKFLSAQVVTRYQAYLYFGDTKRGKWEANHSIGILGGLTLWF